MNKMTRDILMEVYDRMLTRYGPQHWWPAESRFEIIVGAVLTQATAWTNVEKAIDRLKAVNALSPQALRNLPLDELGLLIYSAGYYNVKARRLRAIMDYLDERFDDNIDTMELEDCDIMRAELMGVHGIGEETADDILLYAMDKPVFVVDAYTKRVFFRLGLVPERGIYSTYSNFFMCNLPAASNIFGEYHALIVRHGKNVCKKQPLCRGCCLLDVCPTGRANVLSNSG